MAWQWIVGGFLVALPFALTFDLHPQRERSDAGGRPLYRRWTSGTSGTTARD